MDTCLLVDGERESKMDELIDAISELDFAASPENWDATCKRIKDALFRVQNATAALALDFTD